jgi:hypothetical protein
MSGQDEDSLVIDLINADNATITVYSERTTGFVVVVVRDEVYAESLRNAANQLMLGTVLEQALDPNFVDAEEAIN